MPSLRKRAPKATPKESKSDNNKSSDKTSKSKVTPEKAPKSRSKENIPVQIESDREEEEDSTTSKEEPATQNGSSNCSSQTSSSLKNNSVITSTFQCQINGVRRSIHYPIEHDFHSSHVGLIRGRVISKLRPVYGYQFEPSGANRVTAIAWHPKQGNLLLVGAKHGTIYCNSKTNELVGDHNSQWALHFQEDDNQGIIDKGTGPGGAITAISCDPNDPDWFYTSSISGHVSRRSISTKTSESLLVSDDPYRWWFTAVDQALERNLIVAGDSRGNLYLCDPKEGRASREYTRAHKSKIHDAVLHPKARDILVTTSVERVVKIWDIRKLSASKPTPITTLDHDSGVAAASFNPTDGTRLLTTDLDNQIRIYDTGSWSLERIIDHPHRKFQHITHIKASWHPMVDIFAVGRYPEGKFPNVSKRERGIDFYDAKTGQMIEKLQWDMLVSLNEFNSQGDCMASGIGSNLLLWKPGLLDEALLEKRKKEAEERRRKRIGGDYSDDSTDDDDDDDANQRPRYAIGLPKTKRPNKKKISRKEAAAARAEKIACRKRR